MEAIVEFVDFIEEGAEQQNFDALAAEILMSLSREVELVINPVNTFGPHVERFNRLLPPFLGETNKIILGDDEESKNILRSYIEMKATL